MVFLGGVNMGIEKFYIACTRKRPIWGESDTGRPKITGYSETPINGYIGSSNDVPGYVGGQYTVTKEYKFFTDDFNMLFGDFVVYEGKTYQTAGEPKNTAHRNHHIRIMLEKIDNIKQY